MHFQTEEDAPATQRPETLSCEARESRREGSRLVDAVQQRRGCCRRGRGRGQNACLPEYRQEDGEAAVLRNKLLRSIVAGNGLERVAAQTFAGSGVRRVELPAALREIGEAAFDGCRGLRCLAFRASGENPSAGEDACAIGANAFRGCEGLREVRAEAGCGFCFSAAGFPPQRG